LRLRAQHDSSPARSAGTPKVHSLLADGGFKYRMIEMFSQKRRPPCLHGGLSLGRKRPRRAYGDKSPRPKHMLHRNKRQWAKAQSYGNSPRRAR
jgi:hypothetical protein